EGDLPSPMIVIIGAILHSIARSGKKRSHAAASCSLCARSTHEEGGPDLVEPGVVFRCIGGRRQDAQGANSTGSSPDPVGLVESPSASGRNLSNHEEARHSSVSGVHIQGARIAEWSGTTQQDVRLPSQTHRLQPRRNRLGPMLRLNLGRFVHTWSYLVGIGRKASYSTASLPSFMTQAAQKEATIPDTPDKPVFPEKEARQTRNVRLDKLFFGELNERLEPGDLEGLAKSISQVGVLEPLLVRPVGDRFEIIAGGRRYRAAEKAGLQAVPCQIKELDDIQALQASFQENEERKSASPL